MAKNPTRVQDQAAAPAAAPSAPDAATEAAAAKEAEAAAAKEAEEAAAKEAEAAAAKAAEEAAAKDKNPAPGGPFYSVRTAGQATRRRAGRAFGPEAVLVDTSELSPLELDALLSDPLLICSEA